jgi:hypothetical protein
MPLPSKPLAAIQVAGASAFRAQAELDRVVNDYAAQVHACMLKKPFDISNDGLYEEWKTVARLAQAMGQIETELQKIYAAATALGSVGVLPATPRAITTSAVMEAGNIGVVREIDATDVMPKKLRKKVNSLSVPAKIHPPLKGNTGKVFEQLVRMLDPNAFTKINQSALAAAAGIPKGSIGAAMAKLLDTGYLSASPLGEYKINTAKD